MNFLKLLVLISLQKRCVTVVVEWRIYIGYENVVVFGCFVVFLSSWRSYFVISLGVFCVQFRCSST